MDDLMLNKTFSKIGRLFDEIIRDLGITVQWESFDSNSKLIVIKICARLINHF